MTIDAQHIDEPGLVVLDITAADEEEKIAETVASGNMTRDLHDRALAGRYLARGSIGSAGLVTVLAMQVADRRRRRRLVPPCPR
ncbi:DUF6207 family protein [Streptomyces sp. NPDC058439]|uniref:DUF6207 family protein n=1 Tax=Streptomyces sp. NPDC058439 TaxID=3346500 RepID=UPI0036556266